MVIKCRHFRFRKCNAWTANCSTICYNIFSWAHWLTVDDMSVWHHSSLLKAYQRNCRPRTPNELPNVLLSGDWHSPRPRDTGTRMVATSQTWRKQGSDCKPQSVVNIKWLSKALVAKAQQAVQQTCNKHAPWNSKNQRGDQIIAWFWCLRRTTYIIRCGTSCIIRLIDDGTVRSLNGWFANFDNVNLSFY